jgi:hypothetical protein
MIYRLAASCLNREEPTFLNEPGTKNESLYLNHMLEG